MSYIFSSVGLVVRDPADCMLTSDAADMPPSRGVACAHCTSDNTVLDITGTGGFISYCEASDRTCGEAALVFVCADCGKLTALRVSTDACGWSALSTGPIDHQDAARAAAQAKDRVRREAFEWALHSLDQKAVQQ